MAKDCPNCGSEDTWSNSSDNLFCDNCGYDSCEDDEKDAEEENEIWD